MLHVSSARDSNFSGAYLKSCAGSVSSRGKKFTRYNNVIDFLQQSALKNCKTKSY